MAFTHILNITCPCCGTQVECTDAGFAATSVTVAACPTQRAKGIVSYTVRKTEAYAAVVPTSTVVRHRDGLVGFAG